MMNIEAGVAVTTGVLLILTNISALVWGAAVLSTTVKHLSKAVEKLDSAVERIISFNSEIDKRVAVLEEGADAPLGYHEH